MLGLLWQTSPDPVNPVAINYSNTCMIVESLAWVKDMSDNYFMSLTGKVQVIQHDQWYFVSVSRPGQLWISHNVEWPQNEKNSWPRRQHKLPWSSGQEAPGGKNSAHNDGSPSHHHQQRKHFAFLNSNRLQVMSEYTVERDHCITCWSMCVESLLNTSNLRIPRTYKKCTRWT